MPFISDFFAGSPTEIIDALTGPQETLQAEIYKEKVTDFKFTPGQILFRTREYQSFAGFPTGKGYPGKWETADVKNLLVDNLPSTWGLPPRVEYLFLQDPKHPEEIHIFGDKNHLTTAINHQVI